MKPNRDKDIKEALTDNIWYGGLYLAIAGASSSYIRYLNTDALYVFAIQFTLAIFSVTFFFYRKRFPVNVRINVAIFMFYGVGSAALVEYGFYSAGLMWLVVATLLLSIFYQRITGLAFVAVMTFCLFIAVGFVSGTLSPPKADLEYIEMPELWFTVVFVPVIFCFVLVASMRTYCQSLEVLNNELELKNKEVEYYANHDNLTGLPSLRLANDRLDMALSLADRNKSKTALIYIDLDGFKAINDIHGHDVGDLILIETAKRLSSLIRQTDTSCRVGGDEFLIIIPDIEDSFALKRLCASLVEHIRLPIQAEEHTLTVGASLGVAVYPDNATDAKSLKRSADIAMYKVKKSGKQGFEFAELIETVT